MGRQVPGPAQAPVTVPQAPVARAGARPHAWGLEGGGGAAPCVAWMILGAPAVAWPC